MPMTTMPPTWTIFGRSLAGALFAASIGLAGISSATADPSLQLAQAGGVRGGPPTAGAPQKGPAGQPAAPPNAAGQVERQIADLQRQLAITPAQKPQFDGVAQVIRDNAKAMDAAMQQAQQNKTPNALEDLRMAAKLAEIQSDGMKRLVPAFQSLYESLSDQQKRIADGVLGQSDQGPQPPPPRKKG